MNTTNTPVGTSLTDNNYFVFYGNHEQGAPAGFMLRDSLESAERAGKLMWECGYRFIAERHALSVAFQSWGQRS